MDTYVIFWAIIKYYYYYNKDILKEDLFTFIGWNGPAPFVSWPKSLWVEQNGWMSCIPWRLKCWGSPGRHFTEIITEKMGTYSLGPGDCPLYFWYSHNKIQYIVNGFKVKHDFITEILKAYAGSIPPSIRNSFNDVRRYHMIWCTNDMYFRYHGKHLLIKLFTKHCNSREYRNIIGSYRIILYYIIYYNDIYMYIK